MIKIFCILSICAHIASGASYYVRKGGNNSCNGTVDVDGSSGNCAKLTVQAGINLAGSAGDSVTVHTGTYSENILSHASGSSGNPITIQAYSGETVTINKIEITHNYNKVDGFRIVSYGAYENAGVHITGNHEQIMNNTIIGDCNTCTGGEGACTGLTDDGSGNNTITGNTFDGVSNGAATAFGQCIYTGTGSSANSITSNIFKDINTPGRVFELYGSGHIVSQNEIRNVTDAGCTGSVHTDLFQIFNGASTDILLERNYIHDIDAQYIMIADWMSPAGTEAYWTMRNNVYANVKAAGFVKGQHVAFYNNTMYNVGPTGGYNYLAFSTDSEGNGEFGVFENNLVVTPSTQGIATDTTTISNNYFGNLAYGAYNLPQGSSYISGGDPHFVAAYTDCVANTCDFHITVSSVVIDQGMDLSGLFTTDYDGNVRVGSWDIGAYEYGSGAGQPSHTRTGRITSAGKVTHQ